MNNAVKDLPLYFKEIKTSIPCTGAQKRKYLKELEFSIQEYQASHPQASLADIEQQFGTAEEISEAFLAEESLQRFQKQNRKCVKLGVTCVLVVLFMGVFVSALNFITHRYYSSINGSTAEVIVKADEFSEGKALPEE
jgi:hypothetical protein